MMNLNEIINASYDNEIKESERLQFERKLCCSKTYKDYESEQFDNFRKISMSILKVKTRLKNEFTRF